MPTETVMVAARGLTRCFGSLTAVDHLDLQVFSGEIFGLVGPDGAGKTTTLRLLCGLLEANQGTAEVTGYDVSRQTLEVKDRIGYMPQRFGLYPDLTVEENLGFFAALFGLSRSQRLSLAEELLRMTRMTPFRGRQAGQLSGGMKQKLGLMCTLLHRPSILFLDEPTTGVDPVSRRDFWALLYQLVKEGVTVFVTTAYLDEAERCSRVGFLYQGRLIRCDRPQALASSLEESCYAVEAPQPRSTRETLLEIDGVLSVEFSGRGLHLFLSPSRSPREIEELLGQAGQGPARLTPTRPSLEDVFIALVRKQSRRSA